MWSSPAALSSRSGTPSRRSARRSRRRSRAVSTRRAPPWRTPSMRCGGDRQAADEEDRAFGGGQAVAGDVAVVVGAGPGPEIVGGGEREEDHLVVAPLALENLG